jgi:LuxR family maltose regulon positive regulatory protein
MRLQERLSGSEATARLTAVVGTAGWGKTTLLATWARTPELRQRVAWLSLDEADDEPVRFWTYALSALHLVAPHLVEEPLSALRAPGMDPVGVALSALLNALSTSEDSYVMILDDFHALHDPLIHQSVEFLLTYLPPSLHLVIASRMDPPLPLARMRARGELAEVRVADLACSEVEGVELLARVGGVSQVPESTRARLVERTEGWPAGLHLAAITLRTAEAPDAMVADLRGDGRHILDYFAAEVLPLLVERQRDLLVRSSVLERLSGPLCDAVLESSGASAQLDELDRSGLFVSALEGGWYRCHQLFREVLRRELDKERPTEASILLSRAADWFLSEGLLEEAIEHRQASGDDAGSLDLILTGQRWFLDRGASASLLKLGERLAGSVTDPRLFLTLAVAAGESGQVERCALWLQRAEPLIDDDIPPLTGWRSLLAAADTIRASFPDAGDAETSLRHATRAVALEHDATLPGYAISRLALGGALFGAGRLAEASEVLQNGWRSPARRELPALLLLQFAGHLSMTLIEAGDHDRARRVSREVHNVANAAEEAWGRGAAAALASLRLAEARLLMATDPKASIPALNKAADLAEDWGWPTIVLATLAHLAAAQWAVGDRAAARVALARAREVANTGEARPEVVRHLDELEARVGRAAGNAARERGALTEQLTDRELSILRTLRGPLTARQIGSELYLSINTVKGYMKSLYRKLGVATREDAVRRGQELGLI